MNIEPIQYHGWPEAYRCLAGPLELIAVTSFGPRLLSLRLAGGENLLYEDDSGFMVGAWRLYGGHRFTVAPESEESYVPDNKPCQTRMEHGALLIQQQLEDGLSRTLEISMGLNPAGFRLRHVLRNDRSEPWEGALWAITCVPPAGRVLLPKPEGPARFWAVAGQRYAGPSSPQWCVTDDRVVINPNGEKGKMGLKTECTWLALLRSDAAFVIRGSDRVAQAAYPDEGCNVEVYTCAAYLEVETLGPLGRLRLGQELVHEQHWQVLPPDTVPETWADENRLADGVLPFTERSLP